MHQSARTTHGRGRTGQERSRHEGSLRLAESLAARLGGGEDGYKAAEAVLEQAGWSVYGGGGSPNPKYIKGREPLRKLAELREKFPIHYLRAHVEEVLGLALTWCKGASLVYGNGRPPEGVTTSH